MVKRVRVRASAGLAVLAAVALAGCGGEPPEELYGFQLRMTQSAVMDTAYARDGFACRLVASRPRLTLCSGPTAQGQIEATARGDSVVRITLEVGRHAEDPGEAVRGFVKPFGRPAWDDRPYPPRVDPPEGYHTYWVADDSTRGIALLCRGPELEPPCNARLAVTSPAGVQAKLDTLMGIRR